MKAYKKLIFDEQNNTLIGKGLNSSAKKDSMSSQLKKFDNSYDYKKVQSLFSEYDKVTVADTDIENFTLIKTNAVTESAVAFKTKLFIVSAISTVALLLFLAIYNIFVINSMSNGIKLLQDSVVSNQHSLYEIIETYEKLPDEETFKAKLRAEGYKEDSDANVQLDLPDTVKYNELWGSTNWFDSLCNFISSLFNGG